MVPNSTSQLVAVPFGFTLPETVAVVGPALVTGPVVAVGAVAPAAEAVDSRAAIVATAPVASSLDMMCGDNRNAARCAMLAGAILRSPYTVQSLPRAAFTPCSLHTAPRGRCADRRNSPYAGLPSARCLI